MFGKRPEVVDCHKLLKPGVLVTLEQLEKRVAALEKATNDIYITKKSAQFFTPGGYEKLTVSAVVQRLVHYLDLRVERTEPVAESISLVKRTKK